MNSKEEYEQKLQETRQDLARLERVREVRTKQFEKQLASAGEYAVPSIQKQFDEWKSRNDEEIKQANFLIEHLEKQIKEKTEQARSEGRAWLEKKKAEAWESWETKGGTRESFDAVWLDMERDYLKQQAMKSIGE